jgi:predicted ATP-dependent endonuclease of OLD family
MHISKIIIENFKGISRVELVPIGSVNVVVGRNNSGKSSVLQCIESFVRHLQNENQRQYNNPYNPEKVDNSIPESLFRIDTTRGENYIPIRIVFELDYTPEDQNNILMGTVDMVNERFTRPKLSKKVATDLLSGGFLSKTFYNFHAVKPESGYLLEEVYTYFRTPDEVKITIGKGAFRNIQVNRIIELLTDKSANMATRIQSITSFSPNQSNQDILKPLWIDKGYEKIYSQYSSSFIVSPFRHGIERQEAVACTGLNPDGSNIVQYFHNLALNKNKVFQEIAHFVKKIVPEVGRLHPRFVVSTSSNLELAYEWAGGHVVNIANMGGGVEQLLILGSLLIDQKPAIIMMEEPESHLHPGAQEILLNEMIQRVDKSTIFMTTHSPVFIRDHDVAVHVISNPDGKNATGRTLSKHDLHEAVHLIGSRPGHLVQADIAIYVEGKYGAVVIEKWLEKWPDRMAVLEHLYLVIASINPDELGAKDSDKEILNLNKLTPNMVVFVDRDNAPSDTEPKATRKQLKKYCTENAIPFTMTDKRQIEDYFPEAKIKSVLSENQQLSDNWSKDKIFTDKMKRYNGRIADTMEWEEISQHQVIMQLFEQIAKAARKLKPEPIGSRDNP